MKYAIGIDIGGTKISIVLGNSRGKILLEEVLPTLKGKSAKKSVFQIQDHIQKMIQKSRIRKNQITGIGIGIPGPVDGVQGIVPKSPHMTGWKGMPLRKILSKKTGLPVFMTNDANAAALGEKYFGEGSKERHFVYMTVSTGVGGGLVSNGLLIEGQSFMGGEVGHMKIVSGGRKCMCGKLGCLEAYASGTAIALAAGRAIEEGRETIIPKFIAEDGRLSAKEVGLAAKQGDKLALELFREAGYFLGIGISNILHLINPGMVVLGGGVFKSCPREFWTAMLKSCKEASWPPAWNAVRIRHSRLKNRVGDLGALAVAFDKRF